MNQKKLAAACAAIALTSLSVSSTAAVITFDDVVTGVTSYSYDGDGDFVNDVIFSTTDPSGFNTVGPGPNMSYINEPGLEGTTFLPVDLQVDFLNGAVDSLSFGFAVSTGVGGAFGVNFSVFDSSDTLLGSTYTIADFTSTGFGLSAFPEAIASVSFGGTASYATFDFDSDPGRYIIDNFNGTFGSTEDITPSAVPVPAAVWLFGSGLLGLVGVARRR